MGTSISKEATAVSNSLSIPKKDSVPPKEQTTSKPEAKSPPISKSGCPVNQVKNNSSSSNRCPMKRSSAPIETQNDIKKSEGCPVKFGKSSTNNSNTSACPVKHSSSSSESSQVQYNVYSQPLDPKNNMPSVANQLPSAHQKEELSTDRKKSTIPKGGTDNDTWVYPSPQMFYNALVRKNKLDDTTESDIKSVVALHNNMNEKTWAKILEWEAVLDTNNNTTKNIPITTPKLSRFIGRPSDLSPKARIKNMFFSHPLPFDRHDWTVLRPDGTEVRYVIDYYHDETRASDQPDSGLPAMEDHEAVKSILVDVRPALDSLQEWKGRFLTMPLARQNDVTKFEPLPFMPTKEMVGQVKESIEVWDNIQKSAKEKADALRAEEEASTATLITTETNPAEEIQITNQEAIVLAKSFSNILKQCNEAKQAMESCEKEDEYAQASLALSMCMAQIICPLQHKTVVKTIHSEDGEESEMHERKVDSALENMMMCVGRENDKVSRARSTFPELFQTR